MTTSPTLYIERDIIRSPKELLETTLEYASKASPSTTKRTYLCGWNSFAKWCELQLMDPITAKDKESLIAFYLADKAKSGSLKINSIATYLAAIRDHYEAAGIVINIQHPAIRKVLKGIRNELPKRPVQKDPILTEDLKEMLLAIPIERNGKPSLIGLRDRALLLLGFSGAFRRSELVALNVEDIAFERDGFKALVRRAKCDQEGEGLVKRFPYGSNPITCPVRALQDWLKASGVTSGPIFRTITKHGKLGDKQLTGHSVALIVKRNPYVQAQALEYANEKADVAQEERELARALSIQQFINKFSGHSLRAGFITSAARRNVPLHLITEQTGQNEATAHKYIRKSKNISETAAAMVGL